MMNIQRWLAVQAGNDTVRLVPVDANSSGPDVFIKLSDVTAVYEAGKFAERNRCQYPDCVDNEDERCSRWLTGECKGPKQEGETGG